MSSGSELPPAFVKLVEELTELVRREQPDDVYQFSANFCNKKLEIQRTQLVAMAKGHRGLFSLEGDALNSPYRRISDDEDDDARSADSLVDNPPYYNHSPDTDLSDGDDEEVADDLIFTANLNRGRRISVSAESMDPTAPDEEFVKVVIPKSEEQRLRIQENIGNNFLFRNLDEEQRNDIVNAMAEKCIKPGDVVIQQGAVGDFFYVVESGTLDVFVSKDGGKSLGDKVTDYTAGGSFGELALMYNAPRAATVVATSECILWALDRVSFRRILMESTSRKRRMYENFLEEVPLLMSLIPYERSKIADALETVNFDDNQYVIQQGDVGDNFYIIEEGEAIVLKQDSKGLVHPMGMLKKGDYFGELALLTNKPRAASIIAKGRLKCATLGKKAFVRLLGPVVDIIKRNAENYARVSDQID